MMKYYFLHFNLCGWKEKNRLKIVMQSDIWAKNAQSELSKEFGINLSTGNMSFAGPECLDSRTLFTSTRKIEQKGSEYIPFGF